MNAARQVVAPYGVLSGVPARGGDMSPPYRVKTKDCAAGGRTPPLQMNYIQRKGQSMDKEVRVRVPQVKDLEAAIRMFYEKNAFSVKDIMQIFGVSNTTANRLKQRARAQEEKENIPCWNERFVNPDAAFRAWGLDIGRMEASLKRLRALKIYKEAE